MQQGWGPQGYGTPQGYGLPPQGYPGGYGPQPPPKKGMSGAAIALIVLAAVTVLGGGSCGPVGGARLAVEDLPEGRLRKTKLASQARRVPRVNTSESPGQEAKDARPLLGGEAFLAHGAIVQTRPIGNPIDAA